MVAVNRQQPVRSSRLTPLLVILVVVIVTGIGHFNGDSTQILEQMSLSMSSVGAANFQLANHDSFGFFQDITEKDWLLRKNLTLDVEHNFESKLAKYFPKRTARWWHQLNWNPDFACFHEVAVGGNDDGHKFVCDPHRLPSDCLVYSFGSNGDFSFELDLNRRNPDCEIHIFDPGSYEAKMNEVGVRKAQYHKLGLTASYKSDWKNVREKNGKEMKGRINETLLWTLPDIVKDLGHEGRKVDVFKIDCEGCEWSTYKDWLNSGIDLRQILVEVHNQPEVVDDFFEHIHSHGYVIFHKEPNIQWSGGDCVEFSMLKLHQDFFKK